MDDYAIPGREYALVFATAALVTYLVTGVVRLFATKVGAVTPIRDRDVHRSRRRGWAASRCTSAWPPEC